MAIQDLTASLDLKQNLNIYTTCKQFDDLILEFNIYDNSIQADLTNYDVRLKALKADKVPLIQQHIGITINSNIVNIEADEQLTTISGKTLVELQFINKTTGKKKATFNLVLIVVPSILDVNATISKSTYTLLEELENKLDQASDFFENIDTAITANNELKETITDSENAKTNLDGSITTADASKIALDTINTNATNTKNVLDALKTSADNTKKDLNTVNTTGQSLLNSLEDFENQHADVSDISNKLANVNGQLSETVYENGLPIKLGINGNDRAYLQVGTTSSLLNQYKYKYLRIDLIWWSMETSLGVYATTYDDIINDLISNGITPIILLQGCNALYNNATSTRDGITSQEEITGFTNFAKNVAEKFKNNAVIYEIWNEPDGAFWQDSDKVYWYTKLCESVYSAIKAIDNTAKIAVGAFFDATVSFAEDIIKLGVLDYCDYVSTHCYYVPPEKTKFEYINKLKGLIALYNNRDIPIIITETGYRNNNSTGDLSSAGSEENKGYFNIRSILSAMYNDVEITCIYTAFKGTDTSEGAYYMSMFNNAGIALESQNIMNAFFQSLGYNSTLISKKMVDINSYLMCFKKNDNSYVNVYWTSGNSHNLIIDGINYNFTNTPQIKETTKDNINYKENNTNQFIQYFKNKFIKQLTKDTIVYISPTGNDDTGDGTINRPWATFEKAIRMSPIPAPYYQYTISALGGSYAGFSLRCRNIIVTSTDGNKLTFNTNVYIGEISNLLITCDCEFLGNPISPSIWVEQNGNITINENKTITLSSSYDCAIKAKRGGIFCMAVGSKLIFNSVTKSGIHATEGGQAYLLNISGNVGRYVMAVYSCGVIYYYNNTATGTLGLTSVQSGSRIFTDEVTS